MNIQAFQPTIAFFAAAVITAVIGLYALKRRTIPGAASLAWMMLAITTWSFGVGMEGVSQTKAAYLFWGQVASIGVAFMPVAALVFTLSATGRRGWLTRYRLMSLLLIPLLTILLIWTNDSHQWYTHSYEIVQTDGVFGYRLWQGGIWYWVHAAYSYGLLGAIMVITAVTALRSPQPFRGQAASILLGGGLSLLITIPFSLNNSRPTPLLLPLLSVLNSLIFTWAIFRFRLLDLAPIARNALVESMTDGMLVVDDKNRVVDANPSWEKLTGIPLHLMIGRTMAQLPSPWADLADKVAQSDFQQEIVIQQHTGKRYLHLQSTTLTGRNGRSPGHLLLLHDLTPLKLMETLEMRVAARTRDLATLYNVASLISQNQILQTILDGCLTYILQATDGAAGVIFFGSPHALRIAAWQGATDMTDDFANELFWLQVAAGKDGFLVHDLTTDPRTAPFLAMPLPYPSLIAAPICPQEQDQDKGALVIFGRTTPCFNVEDLGLLLATAEQIGIALDNDYLRRQAETAVLTAERHRLARDLHDSVTQLLYSQMLFADAAQKQLLNGRIQTTADHLDRLGATARQALREMRLLIYQLRPLDLSQADLFTAVQRRLEMVEQRAGLEIHVEGTWPQSLPTAVEEEIYHLIEEALNNALKHAAATAVTVAMHATENWLELQVSDNGRGFDPATVQPGLGFNNLHERAAHLGGHLEISSIPGTGTAVKAGLPTTPKMKD